MIITLDRRLFEGVRYCAGCGRRLSHLQWKEGNEAHVFEKHCPSFFEDRDKHFWFVHRQPVLMRNKNGKLTTGAKNYLREHD